MCRTIGLRGCPHDGLGCTGGKRCSINSEDVAVSGRAYNAGEYGPDFICAKREYALDRQREASQAVK